jgi:hypothetical protein
MNTMTFCSSSLADLRGKLQELLLKEFARLLAFGFDARKPPVTIATTPIKTENPLYESFGAEQVRPAKMKPLLMPKTNKNKPMKSKTIPTKS